MLMNICILYEYNAAVILYYNQDKEFLIRKMNFNINNPCSVIKRHEACIFTE